MKNYKNIFINNNKTTEQYCFILDGNRYYRFNGKFALYEQGMISEKKEYALRIGNVVESKQVYGIFSGACPNCGKIHEDTPVVKYGNTLTVICEGCAQRFKINECISIVNVLDFHINRNECINYEIIDVDEEETAKIEDFIDEIIEEDE